MRNLQPWRGIPWPRLLGRDAFGNEIAAIAVLENVLLAQSTFRSCRAIDADGDGDGEFGFFGELAGQRPLRTDDLGHVGSTLLDPPALAAALGNVHGSRIERRGYLFQMYLPGSGGTAQAEAAEGGAEGVILDPTNAERFWCCYAWPATARSGRRAFFVNQSGTVVGCDNDRGYCGHVAAPPPTAAFLCGSNGGLDCGTAIDAVGLDRQPWTVVR